MTKRLKRFIAREEGATAIEYAALASLLMVGIIVLLNTTSDSVQSAFNSAAEGLRNNNTP